MGALRVHLFGTVSVGFDDGGSELKLTRTARGLFAFLLLHRDRLHARDALTSLFWAEQPEEKARCCLNTALWRLRRSLGRGRVPETRYLITLPTGEVGFNPKVECWLDVAEYESVAESATAKPFHSLEHHEAGRLERALSLYTGDLMEGFSEDWTLRERERYRCLHLNALISLAQYHGYHGEYEKGLSYGQRVLAVDPLREEMHRYVIRVHLETGERAAAVRQYETCRDVLRRELDIEPMEETQLLWARALGRRTPERATPWNHARGEALERAICELRDAVQGLQDAKGVLERAVALVERLSFAQEG